MPYGGAAYNQAPRPRPPRNTSRTPTPQVTPDKLRSLTSFNLHYGQALLWQARSTHRVVSAFAGTGSGKTWYGPRHFYPIIREKPDATYLFIEPTWRMMRRVMLPVVEELYNALGLGYMHRGDMIYHLYSGGRILFGSVDNPNSLQGVHIDGGIWADEIGLYTEDAWDVILQRSALYKCPILNTSTPYTLPWVERRLAKPARDPKYNDEYFCIQFPSHWNPAYPREQYFRLKRLWPADKFDRLMRGLFTRIGGLMFDGFDESRNLAEIWAYPPSEQGEPRIFFRHPVECPEGEVRTLVRTWLAQDWGWSPDPGCQLLFGEDGLGRRYVIEEDYDTLVPVEDGQGRGDDTWVSRGLARQRRWGIEVVYCDPSRPSDIDAFCKYGLPAVKANNKIDQGADRVNEWMRPLGGGLGSGLYIGHSCVNTVRTIATYVRQRASGADDAYLKTPAPHQEDHAMDTLRYGCIGTDRVDPSGRVDAPPIILSARRKGSGNGDKRS